MIRATREALATCLVVLTAAVAVQGQQEFDRKQTQDIEDVQKLPLGYLPHPYVSLGGTMMPGGYAPWAWKGTAGLEVESRDLVGEFSAAYDTGHKDNDNDQPNPQGHDRYLDGRLDWRPRGRPKNWFFGGGYRWSQLSTTNYHKGGSRPEFGGGLDWYRDRQSVCETAVDCWLNHMSARIRLNWVMAGTDWQNGMQGLDVGLTVPRPVEKRHLFFNLDLGIYRGHDTLTDRTNIPLTNDELHHHFMTSSMSLDLSWRFW